MTISIRKIQTNVEQVFHEGGPARKVPLLRGSIAAVLDNQFAGHFVEDIMPMMEELRPLGVRLAQELLGRLGGDPAKVEGYGKGAIIGIDGELEHGALWHAPGGYGMREVLGDPKAIVPSTKKVAVAGTVLDVPITHITASYVRSHFDAVQVCVQDSPRPKEIVVVLAMTTGERIHARVGGLSKEEISKYDGLR